MVQKLFKPQGRWFHVNPTTQKSLATEVECFKLHAEVSVSKKTEEGLTVQKKQNDKKQRKYIYKESRGGGLALHGEFA